MVVRGHPGYIPGFLGGFAGPGLRVVIQLDLAAQRPRDVNVSNTPPSRRAASDRQSRTRYVVHRYLKNRSTIKSLDHPVTANIEPTWSCTDNQKKPRGITLREPKEMWQFKFLPPQATPPRAYSRSQGVLSGVVTTSCLPLDTRLSVTTSTERLRRVALAYVVGVTLDVSWQIIEGRSWFFSGSAMSLAPSSINPEERIPRETKKGNLLLLYARNLTAFCTYFNEHTLTSHRSCVTT